MTWTSTISAFSAFFLGAGGAALLIATFEYRHRPRRRTRINAAGCPDLLTTYRKD